MSEEKKNDKKKKFGRGRGGGFPFAKSTPWVLCVLRTTLDKEQGLASPAYTRIRGRTKRPWAMVHGDYE